MIKYVTFAPPPHFQQDNLALTGLFLLLLQITLLHQICLAYSFLPVSHVFEFSYSV